MLLSIIIAAYNVEVFIEKCILSCQEEHLSEHIEVLVVDDGSTDNTLERIENLQRSVKNLNVIQQKNQGLGASRNIGLRSAKGKYVWMIDGDDYIEAGSLDVILKSVETDLDLYCVNYNVSEENGDVLYKAYLDNYISEILSGSDYYQINYEKNYTWQYIFKKELFLKNEIFFKERINMQDSEILPKILFYTRSVKYLDIVGYNYVQYKNSFTNTQDAGRRYKYFQSIIEVRDSLLEFGDSIKKADAKLFSGIQKKIKSLDQIVFNHLVFYKYSSVSLLKNIELLKNNGFYPIKIVADGKMKYIKWGINNFPNITNSVLNLIKK